VPSGSDERTDYLLDVAAELFLSKGFASTSVGEIAAQAKASKSSFYSRFATKEKLFTEVFRRRTDAIFHEFATILLPEGEPREVLCAFGEGLVRCVLAPDSINLLRLVYMESRHIPELGKIFYELGPERGRSQTSEYFQKLVWRGFFRAEMDTSLGAEQFFDLLTGELVRRSALSINPPFTPAEQSYRLSAAVDMFIRAYAVDERVVAQNASRTDGG
jgi:TetR/AcrR family transcriptional repressor of mexJK operon